MNRTASLVLLPFSGLYGAVTKARLALYNAGVFHAQRVAVPVISVGNITAGGTGKTPLVEWVARYLAKEGCRTCIVTRGYGRANEKERLIVSDGNTILADAGQAGDEALLLAERLAGLTAVVADRDRASAAQWAIENLKSNVFILDDGFQTLPMARDLNIVTIDATNPWSNGRLLPAGLLREPRSGLSRADCVVVTRAEQVTTTDVVQKEIDGFSGGCPVILSRMKIRGLRLVNNGKQIGYDSVDDVPTAAFCGIGNPQSFFSQLQTRGSALSYTRAFPDHYEYTQSDIDEIVSAAAARDARRLFTTAKDEVKLRSLEFGLPCYVVDIEIEFENEAKDLRQLISQAVQRA